MNDVKTLAKIDWNTNIKWTTEQFPISTNIKIEMRDLRRQHFLSIAKWAICILLHRIYYMQNQKNA